MLSGPATATPGVRGGTCLLQQPPRSLLEVETMTLCSPAPWRLLIPAHVPVFLQSTSSHFSLLNLSLLVFDDIFNLSR